MWKQLKGSSINGQTKCSPLPQRNIVRLQERDLGGTLSSRPTGHTARLHLKTITKKSKGKGKEAKLAVRKYLVMSSVRQEDRQSGGHRGL